MSMSGIERPSMMSGMSLISSSGIVSDKSSMSMSF